MSILKSKLERPRLKQLGRNSGPSWSERLSAAVPLVLPVMFMGSLPAMAPAGTFGNMSTAEIVMVVAFLVISLGLHEAAHAWVADLCGDSTAKDLGRLSLNPLVHIDPFMTVALPAFLAMIGAPMFGGAKPVPVIPSNLRSPTRDMMFVALAGPAANLVLAVLFAFAAQLTLNAGMGGNQLAVRVLEMSVFFNVLLAVFNMLPIPPLDGSRVMTWLLPAEMRPSYIALERYGMLIVIFAVFYVPPVKRVMWSTMNFLTGSIVDLVGLVL